MNMAQLNTRHKLIMSAAYIATLPVCPLASACLSFQNCSKMSLLAKLASLVSASTDHQVHFSSEARSLPWYVQTRVEKDNCRARTVKVVSSDLLQCARKWLFISPPPSLFWSARHVDLLYAPASPSNHDSCRQGMRSTDPGRNKGIP